MTHILVRSPEPAPAVAAALAKIVDARVRTVPATMPDADFLRALDDADVVIGVLSLDERAWEVVQHTGKPVVLVRADARPDAIERVLVPLDGTEEAAHAVAETMRLLCAGGVEIVVLHVFDPETVPAHWDQSAHAREAWEREFVARYCTPYLPGPCAPVTLRSGTPGETIVGSAERVDLIVLGWSQRLEPGHARTVRTAVAAAPVPVMLVRASGEERDSGATKHEHG